MTWRDVDFRNSVVHVKAKAIWKFQPKNYEERVVPLPTAMIEQLQRIKMQRDAVGSQLVFPNTKGKPDSGHIDVVKRVAYRAKLNCGQCVTKHGNKCAEGPYCQRFFLHKFRHTFATQHLRDGVDIRTLQGWMGHPHSIHHGLSERDSFQRCFGQSERRFLGRLHRVSVSGGQWRATDAV